MHKDRSFYIFRTKILRKIIERTIFANELTYRIYLLTNIYSMKQLKTALFDFDGVVADTERIYDVFWDEMGIKYTQPYEHFASEIKGTTLPHIMNKYFSDYPENIREQIVRESNEFERNMPIPPLAGAIEFLNELKKHGVKLGLVTSSDKTKMDRALRLLELEQTFDTLVTANRITNGKPDPMCYLLAASDLDVSPVDCLVFEDSFAGIQSGTNAGMRVIGLSTTNPVEAIQDKVYQVIPTFEGLTFEDYLRW